MSKILPLHQEVMLLAICDDSGAFTSSWFIHSIAAGMVSELLLLGLIEETKVKDNKKQPNLQRISSEATGDEVLDELLTAIGTSEKPRATGYWVSHASRMTNVVHRIANQLCEQEILRQDEKKVLWLFTQKRYPELDGSVEDAIRARMAEVMFHDDCKPDPRTAVLIALAGHANLLGRNFAQEELQQHGSRIKQLVSGDILAAGAAKEAIQAAQAAIMVATMIPIITTTAIN